MIQDKLQFGDEIMNIYELLNKIVVNRRHSLSANLFTEEAREELDENEKHIFDLLRNISSLGTKINNKGIELNHTMFTAEVKKVADKVGRENITEELKANNQMEWVSRMNNIKNCVNEIILKEYIYC